MWTSYCSMAAKQQHRKFSGQQLYNFNTLQTSWLAAFISKAEMANVMHHLLQMVLLLNNA